MSLTKGAYRTSGKGSLLNQLNRVKISAEGVAGKSEPAQTTVVAFTISATKAMVNRPGFTGVVYDTPILVQDFFDENPILPGGVVLI